MKINIREFINEALEKILKNKELEQEEDWYVPW